MRKFCFNIVITFLASVIFITLVIFARSGEGAVLMLSSKIESTIKRDKLTPVNITKPTGQAEVIDASSAEKRTLTAEDLNHIYIDGKCYDFPLKLDELPDEFTYSVCLNDDLSKEEHKQLHGKNKYGHMINLYYNEIKFAFGIVYDNFEEMPEDDNTVMTLMFTGTKPNEYLPQIVIAGVNVFNTNKVDFNSIYCDKYEYYYNRFQVPDGINNNYYQLCVFEDKIALLSYIDCADFDGTYFSSPEPYYKKYSLPVDYDIATDEINKAMEYTPLPERNEEMKSALDNFYIDGTQIQLPCTLNSLLYTLNADYVDFTDSFSSAPGINPNESTITGKIIKGEESFDFTGLLKHGQSLGDMRIIEIRLTTSINSDEKDSIENLTGFNNISIKYNNADKVTFSPDSIYKFTGYENRTYTLTDYKYNNVIINLSEEWKSTSVEITLSYWGENTELNEPLQ